MNAFPVSHAAELAETPAGMQWLIEDLWAEEAVGILGGEPKCCKSFLALDMAVAVAAATPCLRHFPVHRAGRVLLFPAEDSPAMVRQRLEGICQAAGKELALLDIQVITAPTIHLDSVQDRKRLSRTIEALRPTLLILDPFIRLHGIDENNASEVAPLLAYLRELQRRHHMAIVLVHHARKNAGKQRPGQALRGSSDLHGWGDSNLYLRRNGNRLTLTTEHRGAQSQEAIPLYLDSDDDAATALAVDDPPPNRPRTEAPKTSPQQRIQQALTQQDNPIPFQTLRELCRIRAATLSAALSELTSQNIVNHTPDGYRLAAQIHPVSVSVSHSPIGCAGNGNGKQTHDNSSQLPQPLPLISNIRAQES